MSDIIISTDAGKDKPTPAAEPNIKETLKAADEYKRLKEDNDKLEAEYLRQQELKAKITLGGRAAAGQTNEKTPQEIADEEAKKLLSQFR